MFPDIRLPFTHVERILIDFAKTNKPTIADFMAFRSRLTIGDYLDRYRAKTSGMSDTELLNDNVDSAQMGRYMRRAGDPSPSPRCDCHHIISGGHKDALLMRLVMVAMSMRVNDPHNGCWLPRDWEDRPHMPNYLRSAVPHQRIHTDNYYIWLSSKINSTVITSPELLINALRVARNSLQSGAVPPNVMPKTGK